MERVTAAEERFLQWLSWAAMAAAMLIVCAVCWQLWQAQGRIEMMTRGKTHMLSLGIRTLLATPTIVFAVVPVGVAAACLGVQARFPSVSDYNSGWTHLTAEPDWRAAAVLSLYLPFALLAADSLLFFWWLLLSGLWRGRERALVRRYAGRDTARGTPGFGLLWVAGVSAVGLAMIGHTANVATSAFQRGGVSRLARPAGPGDAVGLAVAAAGAAVLLLLLAAKPPCTSWAVRLGVAGALERLTVECSMLKRQRIRSVETSFAGR